MDDLYAVVGVRPDAAAPDIETEIKKQFRVWNKRINSADLSKRQEAETRIALLSRAREILLDGERRAAYDRELAAHKARTPDVDSRRPVSGADDWLAQARHYIGVNDYPSAAYAAREARNTLGESPEVWQILSRANAGLGRFEDALYEARQAARFDPGNPERHLDIAIIQEELDDWDAAMATYQHVKSLPGGAEVADMGIAAVLLNTGRFGEAIPILTSLRANAADPADRTVAANNLAFALLSLAETVPRLQPPGGYMVSSPAEIAAMRDLVSRASAVATDPELRREAAELDQHLRACEIRRFWPGFPAGAIVKAVFAYGLPGTLLAMIGYSWSPGLFAGLILIGVCAWRVVWLVNDRHLYQWEINAAIARLEEQEFALRLRVLNDPNLVRGRGY